MPKYKIVLVGCGTMSNVWLDYIATREDAEIVSLVDIIEKNAKKIVEKRNLQVPVYCNLLEALDQQKANIVFDVTIPSSHKEVTITSLKAGCHVFGEKPMAESMKDVKEILEVVKETKKNYAVMQNRRFLKPVRSIRKFLDAGKIGTIGSIHANFFLGPHFGGFREMMDNPLILDMAIHTFDQARYMIDAKPISVYCHEYNPPGSWYKGNASAVCIFEMNNGAIFSYNGSWCAEGLNTSWDGDWRITGSKGSVTWNGFEELSCEVIDRTKPIDFMSSQKSLNIPMNWYGQEEHFGCLDEMFASLDEQRLAETDSSDNFYSTAMVFGAIESARTGRKIRLDNYY